jgi:CRISPR/Cas system CSM-associated protein Csm3 (group 7 of RAMP superfamily)
MTEKKFMKRWRIEGLLTTDSPVHVGCGFVTQRDSIKTEKNGKPVDIDAVALDSRGAAYLPGPTIKGNIRSWLKRNNCPEEAERRLFGVQSDKKDESIGGKVEFWNAFAVAGSNFPASVPFWDPARLTGVATSVAIDRHFGAASHNKLFHREFVPPGVSFHVLITGQEIEKGRAADMLQVLRALELGFEGSDQITLGAETASGWGRFTWRLTNIREIDPGGVKAWRQLSVPPVGYEALISVGAEPMEEIRKKAVAIGRSGKNDRLQIRMKLSFDSSFLVNDPSRTKPVVEETPDSKPPDHAPLRDVNGNILLPAKSFRGAFRSQAERILRTLFPNVAGKAACYGSCPDSADLPKCADVHVKDDLEALCPACRLFGASGWRAPVEFSDFVASKNGTPMTQQFLAIDRFTGGGASGLKFDATSSFQPVLEGLMTIDFSRLEHVSAAEWASGLLALTLRDLIEGDITFGFGAAKGYGTCKAEIDTQDLAAFKKWLATAPQWREKLAARVTAEGENHE